MFMSDMTAPPGPSHSTRKTFYDGSTRQLYWTDEEVPYPDGQLIVSRTDLQGRITHANEAFVLMSGYSREELIGAPHCILRHPEMPAKAFASLWGDAQAKRKWHGYVKNLRKDGSFYWVYATVVPNIRRSEVVGYTSVRRKPSRKKIDEITAVYQAWLSEEGVAR